MLRNYFHGTNTLSLVQRFLYGAVFIVLLISIVPFFQLVFYAHPSADDYCYANVFAKGGFWDRVVGEYMGWKGRYFGIFITVLFHQSGDMISNYAVALFIMPIFLGLAFYLFFLSAYENKGSFIQVTGSALAIAVFYIASLPKVSSFLYWADAAFQYQVGSIFFLLALASIISMYRQSEPGKALLIITAAFIFAAIGSTEIFMISLSSLVGLIFIQKFFILKEAKAAWTVILLVAIGSSLLVVLSPGNAVRMEITQESTGDLWYSVRHSLYFAGHTAQSWLSQPLLWLLTILFIPVALKLVYIKQIRQGASWTRLLLMILLITGQIWLSFFATWWAGAISPPGRALNAIYLVFLTGWFLSILEFVAVIAHTRQLPYVERVFSVPVRLVLIMASVSFIFMLLTRSHVPDAYAAINGEAQQYDIEMSNRYQIIKAEQARQGSKRIDIAFDKIDSQPDILVFSGISHNEKDWRNNCFARYYELKSVDVKLLKD
jgi:hypothetical protein